MNFVAASLSPFRIFAIFSFLLCEEFKFCTRIRPFRRVMRKRVYDYVKLLALINFDEKDAATKMIGQRLGIVTEEKMQFTTYIFKKYFFKINKAAHFVCVYISGEM